MREPWPPGPVRPRLGPGEVHVWLAALSAGPQAISSYLATLAADERDRAARFHFDRDRDAYIVGRGILRALLGRYLHQSPAASRISYSEYGKPFVSGSDLRFNLAHAGGLALYAFAMNEPVGIDLEQERALPDAMAIAGRFFSPAEQRALQSLPVDAQQPAFFRIWSRKEAFIKAVGEGLSYPLDGFDVTADRDRARLLRVGEDAGETAGWSLVALPVPAGYAGALAIRARRPRLSRWRYRPGSSERGMGNGEQ